MESSAESPRRLAKSRTLSPKVTLRTPGLVVLALSAPGLVRLFSEPSATMAGLSVACLLLLALASAWCRAQISRLGLERRYPAEVKGSEPFQVQLVVELKGRRPITGLSITDDFRIGETFEGSSFFIPALAANQKICCVYDASCTAGRGWQRWSRLAMTMEDPLGLVRLTMEQRLQSEILVLPPTRVLEGARLLNPACRTGAEDHRAQEAGAGEEFSGTREWRPGDRYRDIHWRSSAKTGILVVRENARVVRPELIVLLHLFRPPPWSEKSGKPAQEKPRELSSLFGLRWSIGRSKPRSRGRLLSSRSIELCVEAAASVVEWGPAAGYRTSLYVSSLQPLVLEAIEPGEGVPEVLRALAIAEPQSTGELGAMVKSVANRVAPGSVVVVIAPIASFAGEESRAALAGLKARGNKLEIVVGFPVADRGSWDDPKDELENAGLETLVLTSSDDLSRILSRRSMYAGRV